MSDLRNDNTSMKPAFSMPKRKCCNRLCPLVKTGPHYFIKTSVINQNFLSQLYLLAFLLPVLPTPLLPLLGINILVTHRFNYKFLVNI